MEKIILDLKQFDPANPQKWAYDDKGLSRLYAEVFKDKHRYNADAGAWMYYDGKRWAFDNGNLEASRDFGVLHDSLLVYAGKEMESGSDTQQAFWKFIGKYGATKKRKDIIEGARECYPIRAADLDKKRGIVNVQDGTLVLDTRELKPHDPADLLTHVCNAYYKPLMYGGAAYLEWEKFILEVCNGRPELAEYMQRVFGYCLTDQTDKECGFLFLGEQSRNGKTTTLDAIRHAMGDYATATDPATLSRQSFANGSRPTPDVAALQGTRLTTVGEPEKGMILDASRFKQWTGNSLITARRLHQDIFTFLPTFKIIFDSNHELEVSDMTIFKSGRMWVIPFDRFFSEEERDTGLKDRFRQQEYTNAIFLWCYWGYAAYKEKGFSDKPAAVIEATERFRKNSDRMEQFMDECMKPSERNTPGQTAYRAFREWVQAAGGQPIGKKGFFVELRRLGVLAATATVNGKTEKNVLVGYEIANELPFPA